VVYVHELTSNGELERPSEDGNCALCAHN